VQWQHALKDSLLLQGRFMGSFLGIPLPLLIAAMLSSRIKRHSAARYASNKS